MAIETLTIDRRYQNDSAKGPFLKLVLTDASNVFVWDEHLFERVPDGGTVVGEVNRTTRFARLESIVDTGTGEVESAKPKLDARNALIVRQVAIKGAIDLLAQLPLDSKPPNHRALLAAVKATADELVAWITEDDSIPF